MLPLLMMLLALHAAVGSPDLVQRPWMGLHTTMLDRFATIHVPLQPSQGHSTIVPSASTARVLHCAVE